MLTQLYIRNYTLIEELNISFNKGFSVITGETGAGKSILLGAVSMLLGGRADSKAIQQGKDRCIIEAHFCLSQYSLQQFFEDNSLDYDAEDTILRREISANGKSRSFINDTPVPLSVMRLLGEQLIDIHSQHQNLLLSKEDFQLNVIDIIAHNNNLLTGYSATFQAYKEATHKLEQLRTEFEKNQADEDFLRFQYQELADAQLQADEQEQLEQELEMLNHAEEIKSELYQAASILQDDDNGIVEKLRTAFSSLQNIEKSYPKISETIERLNSSYIELKDISEDISTHLEHIEFDSGRLETINSRLDVIYSLEKKYHKNSIEELLEQLEDISLKINSLENGEEDVLKQQEEVHKLEAECKEAADKLTVVRKAAAKNICEEMQLRLVPLGIPNIKFNIEFEEKPLSLDGHDRPVFMFSANKNSPLQPISQVASGGEISRVMLSLKAIISESVQLPTIIFDEIDTGVSGKTAEKMAHIMQAMGTSGRQVISITHLPQIAAMGSTHYKVIKEDAEDASITTMKQLSTQQRIEEIAQMLSGSNITEAAIENAKALLHG